MTTHTQSNIERQVMANVGVIYSVRKIFGPTALKAYVFVASVAALWKLVWVTRVFQNFALVERHGVASMGNYLLYAVAHTSPLVQLTLVVGAIAFIALFADLMRAAGPERISLTRAHTFAA